MPTIDCPSCGRKLRVAEEVLGLQVQCPSCGKTFTGPEAPVIPVEPLVEDEDIEPAGLDDFPAPPPPGVPPPPRPLRPVLLSSTTDSGPARASGDLETCPVCGTRVAEDARRCPVCGTDMHVPEELRAGRAGPEPRRDYEPDRGQLISNLGMLSVLLSLPGLCGALYWPFTIASLVGTGLGIAAVTMARHDLDQMERNIMDPDGHGTTTAGRTQGSIGLALGLVGIFLGGVVRLIILFEGSP
jgi:hypothetical protein